MKLCYFNTLLILFAVYSFQTQASQVSISLEKADLSKRPPSDLVYKNERIDEAQAFELLKMGVDFTSLNPYSSNLWSHSKLKIYDPTVTSYPDEHTVINYIEDRASPDDFYRAYVKVGQETYFLSASLHEHTNILRASLLRMIGYDIDTPKYYKNLTLAFKDEEQRENIIQEVGLKTLTQREKWIDKIVCKKNLIIKNVTLTPSKLKNINLYMPVMDSTRQARRRIFRALLPIYDLTQFPQAINSINDESISIFNNSLMISHPYANAFNQVMIEDVIWVLKRISKLNLSDIELSVHFAGYPNELNAFIARKLSCRIEAYMRLLKIQSSFKCFDIKDTEFIKNNKLIKSNFSDYVVSYYNPDPKSPYRISELFKLFRTQITYQALSSALNLATQTLLPAQTNEEALQVINNKIARRARESNSVVPIKLWSAPTANGSINASRNIVFGEFLGQSSPIQLVDTVTAYLNVGILGGYNLNKINPPFINLNTQIGRNYTHVRSYKDIKSASRARVDKVLVPRLLKKMGNLLKTRSDCSLAQLAYIQQIEDLFKVIYDRNNKLALEEAARLRQTLLDQSISSGKILLVPIDRDKECFLEKKNNQKQALTDFIRAFALNETFMINDNLKISAGVNLQQNWQALNLRTSGEVNQVLLRSTVIRKKEDSLEITIQTRKDLERILSSSITSLIELVNINTKKTKGKMHSQIFKIPLNKIEDEEYESILEPLYHLFVKNSIKLIQEHYSPFDLEHKVESKLRTFRLLWKRSELMDFSHELDFTAAQRENESYSKSARNRKLISHSYIFRKGSDYYSFIDRFIKIFSPFGIGSNDIDPGQSYLGSSKKQYFITEAIQDDEIFAPFTKIEFIQTGWSIKRDKLIERLTKINQLFGAPFYKLHEFKMSSKVKSYDIITTILLYPSALKKIKSYLFDHGEVTALNILYYLYGSKRWERYCRNIEEAFGSMSYAHYYGQKKYNCVPHIVQKILHLKSSQLDSNTAQEIKNINSLYRDLFKNFDQHKLLNWLGREHFFASGRVSGFRENHHEGYISSFSNTVGNYNEKIATGYYDELSSLFGLTQFELRALIYTPGM